MISAVAASSVSRSLVFDLLLAALTLLAWTVDERAVSSSIFPPLVSALST